MSPPLPSLSQIWADGYKTRRLPVGKDCACTRPDFEVSAPGGTVLGYSSNSTGVARLVVCHQIAQLKKEAA